MTMTMTMTMTELLRICSHPFLNTKQASHHEQVSTVLDELEMKEEDDSVVVGEEGGRETEQGLPPSKRKTGPLSMVGLLLLEKDPHVKQKGDWE